MKLKKQKSSIITPTEIILDGDLSAEAFKIWFLIDLKPVDWEFSIKDLQKNFKENESSIKAGIEELEIRGYLRRNEAEVLELSGISYEKEKDLTGGWDFAYEPLDKSDFSTRTYRVLMSENITHLGYLVSFSESTLLKSAGFGSVSLDEIKEFLIKRSLKFGIKIPYFVREKLSEKNPSIYWG